MNNIHCLYFLESDIHFFMHRNNILSLVYKKCIKFYILKFDF